MRRKTTTLRKITTLLVTIEQDAVPGWGHQPEDHLAMVTKMLEDRVPHYNPTVVLQATVTGP